MRINYRDVSDYSRAITVRPYTVNVFIKIAVPKNS